MIGRDEFDRWLCFFFGGGVLGFHGLRLGCLLGLSGCMKAFE